MNAPQNTRPVAVAAAVLGVGLSGFFDGILLHQVLQWHHLLSLVPGEALRDISAQILADGLFHLLMYAVTGTGLWMLWRRRHLLGPGGAGWRTVVGGGLLGFGLWNVIDVAGFHWIAGIHRIRIGVPDPMTYDLAWLALLGLVPLGIGWWLLRRGSDDVGRGRGAGAAISLALLALIAAPLASLPPPGTKSALVLFGPNASPARALGAAVAAEAPILWVDPHGRMMAVALDGAGTRERLYGAGALLVTRSPALAGCAAATRV